MDGTRDFKPAVLSAGETNSTVEPCRGKLFLPKVVMFVAVADDFAVVELDIPFFLPLRVEAAPEMPFGKDCRRWYGIGDDETLGCRVVGDGTIHFSLGRIESLL